MLSYFEMSEKNKEIIKKEFNEWVMSLLPDERTAKINVFNTIASVIERELGLWECTYCGKMVPVKDNLDKCPGCGTKLKKDRQ